MNAAMNADINKIPIRSWFDVEKSNYKVLVWFGATGEAKFKYTPDGKLGNSLKNIYQEKILSVPEEQRLNKIGIKGSIPQIANGDVLVWSSVNNFVRFDEYPCQITDIKSPELKYDINFRNLPKIQFSFLFLEIRFA